MSADTWSGIAPARLSYVDERQERLNRLRPWPARAAQRLWQGMLPDWIAGSNALDGNRLTRDETAQLLTQGGAFEERTLREHLEALSHREAIEVARRLAQGRSPLRAATVRRLHALLLAGSDPDNAGRYRTYTLERHGDGASVADLMRGWEKWLAGVGALHPVERAAAAMHRLIYVQPFTDGNGRVARLILNLSLLSDGYLPAIWRAEERHDYRQALYQADQGQYRLLVEMVVRALERIQAVYLRALELDVR